jgi:hypothetical protein
VNTVKRRRKTVGSAGNNIKTLIPLLKQDLKKENLHAFYGLFPGLRTTGRYIRAS